MSAPGLPVDLQAAVETFAALDRVLVATDFDGVLAPLVDDPATSRPVAGGIDALQRLTERPGTSVAVVSGRPLGDLAALCGLDPTGGVTLIGSHGAEPAVPLELATELDDAARERLRAATAALQDVVDRHPPARVEHKPAGVVLHTRGIDAEVAAAAGAEAERVPQQVPGVHAMRGKDVVELSVLDISKGMALQALARAVDAQATLYLGDDVTDERAFAVLPAEQGHVTIKVGEGETVAAHRIAGPDDVLQVLQLVLDRR